MNWFMAQAISGAFTLQTDLPVLEAFGVLLGRVAILSLAFTILYAIIATRQSGLRPESHQTSAAKELIHELQRIPDNAAADHPALH